MKNLYFKNHVKLKKKKNYKFINTIRKNERIYDR